MKKIIIETLVSSEKTAIVEDDKLVELLIEENENTKIVSNIYRGIVKNVKAGLEAVKRFTQSLASLFLCGLY